MTDLQNEIAALAKKAADGNESDNTPSSLAALQYSQAALNLANAARVTADMPRDE